MRCNHCGSSIFASDQFCMECGNPITTRPGSDPQQPTWLPADVPALAPIVQHPVAVQDAGRAQAANAMSAGAAACPNCGARLPQGARFCGDCGTPMANAAVPVAAPARPTK